MALKEYKSKRAFTKTPEPKPRAGSAGKRLVFVVHKHAATRLHYDLRLEMKGVLKSWAVPKGPSMNPSQKRLAVMVEDHPLDYKDFEGVIPEGNYGAGGVIIWDRGFYHHAQARDRKESEKLLLKGLRDGIVEFVLEGKKLRGTFVLVKTRRDPKSWLLFKKKDQFATTAEVLRRSRSVASDKTLEEVSRSATDDPPKRSKIDQIRRGEAMESADLKGAPARPMPHRVRPMLATLADAPFDDPEWIFEIKWDGYRATAEVRKGKAALYSRNLLSMNERFPGVAEALGKTGVDAVLDGEIVAVDKQGRPDFQMLQDYQKTGSGRLVYYVFDLLYLDGHDLTGLPLLKRREILCGILPSSATVKFSEDVAKDGVAFFKAAKKKGLEGVMAKHSQSQYLAGRRTKQWLKVKTHLTQEAVIAGFTEPRGSRKNFGSLVLGVYEGKDLVFIGHTGTGFSASTLREIRRRLDPLVRKQSPFKEEPKTNMPVTWVKPEIVCEVEFRGWTNEGLLRQPAFIKMREDKSAREVVRESGPR